VAWFKVDDRFWSHPKTADLSDGATALWIRAGSWSAGHLTDGRVPVSMLRLFRARRRSADELVSVGLWSNAGDAFVFTSWDEYQPLKVQVEARREATKSRVNTWREGRRNGVTDAFTGQTSNAAPDPTRPDPTPEEAKASSTRKKPETRIPSDWVPTSTHFERATSSGIDIAKQVEAFKLHAETHDRHAANWNAAFTTWLSKAKPSVRVDPREEWKYR
jgi:hypothetical protein